MTRFIRFAMVGVLNTLIHLIVFSLLFRWLQWHYLGASAAGFAVAVINSYLLNKYWTFNAPGGDALREFLRFSGVSVLALSVNLLVMAVLVGRLGMAAEPAQIVAIGLALVVNFTLNNYWVFAPANRTSG